MGKRNKDNNCDENIRLPDNLTEHGFETEDSMQDAEIEFVHGDINDHIHDMKYMLNSVIIFHHDTNERNINDKKI